MERLTETKPHDSGEKRRPRRTRSRWFLNPQTARDAIVYMEILGKPKSEREEEVNGLAGVAELVDALDSKSCIRKGVWVRVPPPAPFFIFHCKLAVRSHSHR